MEDVMKLFAIERIDGAECHACGEFKKNTTAYWLKHLCQHFISLCPKCKPKFKEFLEVTDNLRLKDRHFITDKRLIHPKISNRLEKRDW